MAIMTDTRTLRESAGGPVTAVKAMGGARLTLLETKDGWAKIRLDESGAEGWVSADAIDKNATELGSLDRDEVAWECVDQGFTAGSNAFYLMTVAQLRSNISGAKLPGTDCVGPFGFSQKEWAANVGNLKDPAGSVAPEITRWRPQVWVFARMAAERQQAMAERLERQPNMAELLLGQILGTEAAVTAINKPKTGRAELLDLAGQEAAASGIDPANLAGRDLSLLGDDGAACLAILNDKLTPALDAVRDLVRAEVDQFIKISLALSETMPATPVKVRLSAQLTQLGRQPIADLITAKFAAQGYGALAQIAAVANAIHESALNPDAHNPNGESSIGLFQLNQKGGVGSGFSAAELKDPDRNIEIMLAEIAKPYQRAARTRFRTTALLFEAVDIFVRHFERPANPDAEVSKRFATAQSLIG